jgi:stringent starvation protein B
MQSSMTVCFAGMEFDGKALVATDQIRLNVPKNSIEINKNELEFSCRFSGVALP